MQSSETEKIKLGPSQKVGLFVLAVIAAAIAWWLLTHTTPVPREATLSTDTGTYRLQTADTEEEQRRGLSGRSTMADHEGMLFVFSSQEEQCFWMKDMQFPLDIIWLNAHRRVVAVKANVSPSTYPDAFCTSAQYVIELTAGQAAKAGITAGKQLTF